MGENKLAQTILEDEESEKGSLFNLRETAPKTLEEYVEQALSLPWFPLKPRVARERLMYTVLEMIENHAISCSLTLAGYGVTSLLQEVCLHLKGAKKQTYYISLKHLRSVQIPLALEAVKKELLAKKIKQRRILVVIDDIEEILEEDVQEAALTLRFIGNLQQMFVVLRPKAALLAEELGVPYVLTGKDFLISFDEMPYFITKAEQKKKCISAAQFLKKCNGIISLGEAYFTDALQNQQVRKPIQKQVYETLLLDCLTSSPCFEERELRSAMILLQEGNFFELEKVGFLKDLEMLESSSEEALLLGIQMRAESFQLPRSLPIPLAIQREIERKSPMLFENVITYLCHTQRIYAALQLIKKSASGFSRKAIAEACRQVDPLLFFNAGGSSTLRALFETQEPKDCTARFLLQEVSGEMLLEKSVAPKALRDFYAIRTAFLTFSALPKTALDTAFKPYFSLFFQVLKAFRDGNIQELARLVSSNNISINLEGIIQALAAFVMIVAEAFVKGEFTKKQLEEVEKILYCLKQTKEEKLVMYVQGLLEVSLILTGALSEVNIENIEKAIQVAEQKGDSAIHALLLLGDMIWNYREHYVTSAKKAQETGLKLARQAGLKSATTIFLLFKEMMESEKAPSSSGKKHHLAKGFQEEGSPVSLVYGLLRSIYNKEGRECKRKEQAQEELHTYKKKIWTSTPSATALLLLSIMERHCHTMFQALWVHFSEQWKKEYRDFCNSSLIKKKSSTHIQQTLALHEELEMGDLLPSDMIHIRFLGGYRVIKDGKLIHPREFKRNASRLVLQLLALEPTHQMSRLQIIRELWPEKNVTRGKETLYTALSNLKNALGDSSYRFCHVIAEKDTIYLNMDTVAIDLDLFQKLFGFVLDGTQPAYERIRKARSVASYYQGGIVFSETTPLYTQYDFRKRALNVQIIEVLLEASKLAHSLNMTADELLFLKTALEVEPSREDIVLKYVDLLQKQKRTREAEMVYESFCRKYLKNEPRPKLPMQKAPARKKVLQHSS